MGHLIYRSISTKLREYPLLQQNNPARIVHQCNHGGAMLSRQIGPST